MAPRWLARRLPFHWAPRYNLALFKQDLVAGVTIGIVVVPQGIAYATLAELPPVYGLYAALVPLPIYALLGSSRHISIGPFALISILVAETVTPLISPTRHTEEYCGAVMLLSLMVGLLHLAMAALRLDVVVVSFLSEPVLAGFTTASAILIAASQMKHLLGLPIPRGTLAFKLGYAYEHREEVNLVAVAVGVGGVFLLEAIKRLNARLCKSVQLPEQLFVLLIAGYLCAVFAGGGSHFAFPWEAPSGLHLVGHVPAGLPPLALPPVFDVALVLKLLQPALVVGVFAYILSVSISRTMALKFDYKTDANQELVAFGVANLVGAFFSAYPAAGSLSRSALVATICDGPRCTPLHGVWTSAVILVVLVALTPAFRTLPYAVLASIVFMGVKSLFDFATPRRLLSLNLVDFFLWAVAFVSTLGLGVKMGVMLSIGCSLLTLIAASMRPPHGLLGRIEGSNTFVPVLRRRSQSTDVRQMRGVAIFGFTAPLHFANKGVYREGLFDAIEKGVDLARVMRAAHHGGGGGGGSAAAHVAAAAARRLEVPSQAAIRHDRAPDNTGAAAVGGGGDAGIARRGHAS